MPNSSETRTSSEFQIDRTLIIPVYKNEHNIPALLLALEQINDNCCDKTLEVIFVIDGSPDSSGQFLVDKQDDLPFHSIIVFHSRNFGSFNAIRTGMVHSNSAVIAVMAADLQEPPQLILDFYKILEDEDIDIVFGTRTQRDDPFVSKILSNIYWLLYRNLVDRDMPKGGVDIFGCNRLALDTILEIREPNSSLVGQLFWIGFRRKLVPYKREQRKVGTSAWNFSRRIRYMLDSIFSFSDLPILFVLWAGVIGCILSFGFGCIVMIARLFDYITLPGYAGLAVLVTFSTSLTLAVQGILGSYLWRTFENTKRRPLSIQSFIRRSNGQCDS